MITDSSGGNVEEIHYYPFGETITDTGSVSVSHKYTSQELDIETGLYYYNARYYDPALGRFISADTIVPDPTNPQALNRYSYVLNNPLKYTDPSGHGFFDFIGDIWDGITGIFSSVKDTVQSALSIPAVRFAIAAGVGIYTGYTAVPALIKAELAKAAVIRGAVWKGIVAAKDAYTKIGRITGYLERLSKYTTQIRTAITSSGSSESQTDGGTAISTSASNIRYSENPSYGKRGYSPGISTFRNTGLGNSGKGWGKDPLEKKKSIKDSLVVCKHWPSILEKAENDGIYGFLAGAYQGYTYVSKTPQSAGLYGVLFGISGFISGGYDEYKSQGKILPIRPGGEENSWWP